MLSCMPHSLSSEQVIICPCAAASPGDYSFERDVLRETRCEVHTFDCTTSAREPSEALVWGLGALAGPVGWRERLTFHPWCIHGGDTDAYGSDAAAAGGQSISGGGGGGGQSISGGGEGGRTSRRTNRRKGRKLVFKTYQEITRELGHHRVDVLKVSQKG